MFGWWRRLRRRRLLAAPFPVEWDEILDANLWQRRHLSTAQQAELRRRVQVFVAEKSWEGCAGLAMTTEIQVTIAGWASLMVLEFADFVFENVQSILVYPQEFVTPEAHPISDDTALWVEEEKLGEAHHRGPIILSWADVTAVREPGVGENLVFHEFAHALDFLNGSMDGTPRIDDGKLRRRWSEVMFAEYKQLRRAARTRKATLFDYYGAESPEEFFAVTTECFFDAPWPMRDDHPALYALYRDYYRQDPSTWPRPGNG